MDKKYVNKLTKEERSIMVDGNTETPFSGEYNNYESNGIYVCKS